MLKNKNRAHACYFLNGNASKGFHLMFESVPSSGVDFKHLQGSLLKPLTVQLARHAQRFANQATAT